MFPYNLDYHRLIVYLIQMVFDFAPENVKLGVCLIVSWEVVSQHFLVASGTSRTASFQFKLKSMLLHIDKSLSLVCTHTSKWTDVILT